MDIREPVEHGQAKRLQHLVDDAVVGGEHHAPAQCNRYGREQVGQEQQRTHGLLAAAQAVDEQCHDKADEHFKNHSKDRELDRVPDGLLEVGVGQQIGVVFQRDKTGRLAQVAQQVVIRKAVKQRENQGVGGHDQKDNDRRRNHGIAEAFGLCIGVIAFCNVISSHIRPHNSERYL